MENMQRWTHYAEKKKGVNNKYYEVEAIELEDGRGQWIFRWGRIGYDPTGTNEGTSHSFAAAKQKCREKAVAKHKRGYTRVTAMEALASAVQEPHERPTRGLKAIEIEVPCFHADDSEKRCKRFAQKYLAKLNIVRKSKFELGDTEYDNQMEGVLKGYCAEWGRITSTKAHGHLAENANAQTAFKIFFGALKENAGTMLFGYFEGVGSLY